jgi:hypothetical protein
MAHTRLTPSTSALRVDPQTTQTEIQNHFHLFYPRLKDVGVILLRM